VTLDGFDAPAVLTVAVATSVRQSGHILDNALDDIIARMIKSAVQSKRSS